MKTRSITTILAAAIGVAFGTCAIAAPLTKDAYKAGKDNAEATYKTAKAACDPMTDNAKDICVATAKGSRDVTIADLEVQYKPSMKTRSALRVAKADAEYAVAKERCDDKAGNDKDVCKKEAASAHVAAKADVKADKKVVAARKDAAEDKRDAEYKVAKEKCDVLAGTPKDSCMADAKARYGKS
jgi:hypothetical protein